MLEATGVQLGYARSTRYGGGIQEQIALLEAVPVSEVFRDTHATTNERHGFMLMLARAHPGDTIVVTTLGRLGPTSAALAVSLGYLEACRLHVRVLNLDLDTRSEQGTELLRALAVVG